MIEQLLWRLGIALLIVSLIFVANIFVSIYLYKLTQGQIHQRFKENPKRFMVSSFTISLLFALGAMIPDILTLLLAPILTRTVNINAIIMFGMTQFILIIIMGSPLIWLSYKLGTSLGYKIYSPRF